MDNDLAKIEAVLFAHGEPISLKKLGNLVKISQEELKSALLELENELKSDRRGLALIIEEPLQKVFEAKDWGSKKVQLGTKPELSPLLKDFLKEEMGEELTPANLEVLSIVAYLGPVSRAKIEYIRGVNSVFTLRNLLMRGLIERAADPERGNTFIYKPSLEFLRHLGVASPSELEEFDKFQELKKEQ
jgi:segregation and condensation protein B